MRAIGCGELDFGGTTMTEAEWLACDDVRELLEWSERGTRPTRKWQLFALACIEPIRPHLRDDRLLAALVTVARAAESECTAQELERARDGARAAHDEIWEDASEQRWFYMQECAVRAVVLSTQPDHQESVPEVAARCVDFSGLCAEEGGALVRRHANQRHVALVRDIFGNPFRPVTFDPAWLTSDVLALAARDVRRARVRPDADPRGRTSGRRLRQRGHARPLPRPEAGARPRVLGGRSADRPGVS